MATGRKIIDGLKEAIESVPSLEELERRMRAFDARFAEALNRLGKD